MSERLDTMRDEIHRLCGKDPFEPFRINTSDGRNYVIDDPHAIALGRSKVSFFPAGTDDWHIISILHISSIESAKQAA